MPSISSGAASGTTYIHGGDTSPILYENNLVETSRGRVEVCGLGTGGTSTSNTTIRNNTFYDLARAFGIQGFEWDCDSGTGNLIENNVFADRGGGFDDSGPARTVSNNITGSLSSFTFDADRNCTSANCSGRDTERIPQTKRSALVGVDGQRDPADAPSADS